MKRTQRNKEGNGRDQQTNQKSSTLEKQEHPSLRRKDPPVSHRKWAAPPPDPSSCRGGLCFAGTATGTMQLGLVALAMVFLSSMGHSEAVNYSKARRQRRGESPRFCLPQVVLITRCPYALRLWFLWSESQRRVSYKHLTGNVKITLCLLCHHFYLFFLCWVTLGSSFPPNSFSFFLIVRLQLSLFYWY